MKNLGKKLVIQPAWIIARNLVSDLLQMSYQSIQLLSFRTAFISILVTNLFVFASHSVASDGATGKSDTETEVVVTEGSRVFPLREGWVGAWPVKGIDDSGTVELESFDDQWFKLAKDEYIPAIESNSEIQKKDKVIVTRPEMLGVWEVQYIGTDGRIAVLDVNREPYTLLRNEYIPTVSKFEEIESDESVISRRADLKGMFPILALGSDGSILLSSGDGNEMLLKDGEYVRAKPDAGASFFSRIKGDKNAATEPTRFVPADSGHIRRTEPLLLETETSFLGVKRPGAKAWVYPIEAKGETVEVVFASEAHDATKFRNSLTSYEVPLKWLSASIDPVTEEELTQELKLDRGSLKPHFETTIPRGMNAVPAVLKLFKEAAGVIPAPTPVCLRAMSSIPVSASQP